MCDLKERKERDVVFNLFLLLVLILVLVCTSCAPNKATPTKPIDVAAETGKQLSKAFLLIYDTADTWTKKGTPMQREYAMKVLNPKINYAKPIVVDFDRSVAYWQRTGLAGDDVIKKQQEVQKLYDELQKLIIDAFAEKGV